MKLLMHLIAADARRFRLWIAAWILLVATPTAIDGVGPFIAGNPDAFAAASLATSLLWIAQLVLSIVLVVLVVQTHPLVGTDAFWMTRPIPPRFLLASKIGLLSAVVIGVPLATELVLMAAYRSPLDAMARVTVQTAMLLAVWITVLMAGAAVTRNLPRFALLCGGALASFALLSVVRALIIVARARQGASSEFMGVISSGGDSESVFDGRIQDHTTVVVVAIAILLAGLGFLLVQYRTRSPRRSLPIAASGMVVAAMLPAVWAWPVFQPRLVVPDWASTPSSLKLSLDLAQVTFDDTTGSQRVLRPARGRIHISGIPPGWIAAGYVERATLDISPGVRLSSPGLGFAAPLAMDDDEISPRRVVLQAILGVPRVRLSAPLIANQSVVFMSREEDVKRVVPATGLYRGEAVVQLAHLELVATLPLRVGTVYQDGPYRMSIDALPEVTPEMRGIVLRVHVSNANTMFDRRAPSSYAFILRNRRIGEAAGSWISPVQRYFPLPIFGMPLVGHPGGFSVSEDFIQFPSLDGTQGEDRPLDQDWLRDAELVIVRDTLGGSVSRTLEVSGFPLRASVSTPR